MVELKSQFETGRKVSPGSWPCAGLTWPYLVAVTQHLTSCLYKLLELSPQVMFCLHPQPACVCSAPGCCSRTEYWSAEPACCRDLHILAVKMQLIRCQIYIQAKDLEFFKGMLINTWLFSIFLPLYCWTVPSNLCCDIHGWWILWVPVRCWWVWQSNWLGLEMAVLGFLTFSAVLQHVPFLHSPTGRPALHCILFLWKWDRANTEN